MRSVKLLLVVVAVAVIGMVGIVYLEPEIAAGFIIKADRYRSGLVRKEIDLPNGLHYVYLEGGKGQPLMLLHGFGANKDHFTKVAHYLTPHYRLIVPDHIGFAESSHPQNADYTPTGQAKRLRAFAHALGIDHLHLGGSSMGGQIALTYAALYPADVKSLWLIDPAGIWSAPKSECQKVLEQTGRNLLMARSPDEFRQVIEIAVYNVPVIPDTIINVLAQERITNYALEERIFKTILEDSVENRVAGMSVPSLIVWGDKDRVLSVEAAEILHKRMPRSKVIIMPDIGHLPMMEKPRKSAEDYLMFRAALEYNADNRVE